jgi:hypothetical protein
MMKNWMNGFLDKWIIGAWEAWVLDSLIHPSNNPIIRPL